MERQRAGFTLLELMIVVTVMGTMAAMMAPGLGEFMADIRASGAAEDMVRISRHMRSRVQQSGLAHLLVYQGAADVSGGLGRVDVYEGMTNHCRETPWQQTITGTVTNGHAIIDSVDLGNTAYNVPTSGTTAKKDDDNRQVIALTVSVNQTAASSAVLCYEPGGGTFQGVADSSIASFAFTPQIQPVTFTVTRSVSGGQRGPTRSVVFPAGGAARFRF
jgi:prepilin-type N-terminal cleavage/methylation domain-containing protein